MGANVIMVASGKGGTGKSTVAVLLGAELAARGRRVLLVELDSGLRSVDYIAGVYGKTVYDVEDVLNGRCEVARPRIAKRSPEPARLSTALTAKSPAHIRLQDRLSTLPGPEKEKGPDEDRLGQIRICSSAVSGGASDPVDVAAVETDVIQLAIRQTVQRVFRNAHIIPGSQRRPELRAKTDRARPAMDAVRVNR